MQSESIYPELGGRLATGTRGIKLTLLVFFIGIILANFLIFHEVINDFLWGTLADAERVGSTGHLSGDELNRGYVIALSIVQIITGLSGFGVAVAPVGMIVTPVVVYIVFKKLFENRIIALAIMIYMTTYIAQTAWYGTFAYAWSRPLYFLGLLLLTSVFLNTRSHNLPDKRLIAVLLIIFASVVHLHYTSGGWLIFLLAIFIVFGFINERNWVKVATILLLVFVVIYFLWTRIIYATFLPSIFAHVADESVVDPVSNLISLLNTVTSGESVQEEYRTSRTFPIYTQLRLGLLLILATVIAPGALAALWRTFSCWRHNIRISAPVYLYFALAGTVGVHAIVYGIVFSISPQALLILGPILGILALHQLGADSRLVIGFLVVIVGLSTLSMAVRFGHYSDNLLRYSQISPGAKWFNEYALTSQNQQTSVLGSLHLRHYYNYIVGRNAIQFVYFDAELYASVIGDRGSISGEADYLILDQFSKQEVISGNRISVEYQPLGMHENSVNANPKLNKVYSDGSSEIFRI